ncbi:MAG: hypothetical protein ACKVU1_18580 [bacterium]
MNIDTERLARRCELFLFALLAVAALLAAVVGRPNADEGWYLHAGRRAIAGDLLYRDFAFTQAPLSPYVFGAVQAIVPGPRVRLGRATSVLFLLGAAWCARGFARRIGGRAAGSLALLLILASPDFLYFAAIVKSYALCAFLLALSGALLFDERGARRAWAPFPAALAAATRLSLAPVAAVLLFATLHARREALDDAGRRRAFVAFFLGLSPLLLALADPRAFVDQAIFFHLAFTTENTLHEQVRLIQAMHAPLRGAAAVGLAALWFCDRRAAVWLTLAIPAIVLPNFWPAAHHAEYVELAIPFAAAVAAAGLTRVPGPRGLRWLAAGLFAVWALVAGAHRLDDCYGFRDLDERTHRWDALRPIEEAAAAIDSLSTPGDTLLTWCTIVAVEARRPVPQGLDMAHFSFALAARAGHSVVDLHESPEEFGAALAARYRLLFWERGMNRMRWVPAGFWRRAWGPFRTLREYEGFGQWQGDALLFESKRWSATRG